MGDGSETDDRGRDERLRAVIADDDPFARRVIKDALTESGVLVVAEARSGREAVEFALYFRPDVVIMDVVMPELDGILATRRILKIVPDQLVIVLTGADEDDEIGLLALRAGAAGFLPKDVDPDLPAVARDLPVLIAPLHPLGQQWEPLGHFPVYQLLLPGPTKVEYLFLDHSQQAMPAPKPGSETLDAINTHFWDWLWWIATKASIGKNDLVGEHLTQLFGHLLRPIGFTEPPVDIAAAIHAFVNRRDELEQDYGVTVWHSRTRARASTPPSSTSATC